jgi:hypothetical protein
VFKLPEFDIRERLESIERDSGGAFLYQESAAFQQVARSENLAPVDLLARVYRKMPDPVPVVLTTPADCEIKEPATPYRVRRRRSRSRTGP